MYTAVARTFTARQIRSRDSIMVGGRARRVLHTRASGGATRLHLAGGVVVISPPDAEMAAVRPLSEGGG